MEGTVGKVQVELQGDYARLSSTLCHMHEIEKDFLQQHGDLCGESKTIKRSESYRKNAELFYGDIKGKTIHHIDGKRGCDNVENLLIMTTKDHNDYHKSINNIKKMFYILKVEYVKLTRELKDFLPNLKTEYKDEADEDKLNEENVQEFRKNFVENLQKQIANKTNETVELVLEPYKNQISEFSKRNLKKKKKKTSEGQDFSEYFRNHSNEGRYKSSINENMDILQSKFMDSTNDIERRAKIHGEAYDIIKDYLNLQEELEKKIKTVETNIKLRETLDRNEKLGDELNSKLIHNSCYQILTN